MHEVLMAIKRTPNLMMRPNPLPPSHTRRRDMCCEFHQDFGNITEECIELQEFVEDLIGRGYMKQFVARAQLKPAKFHRERDRSPLDRSYQRRDRRSLPPPRKEVRIENRVIGEILVISRGPIEMDNTNSKKVNLKRARREVMMGAVGPSKKMSYTISFSSSSRQDILKPYVDPLVIIALVSSFPVGY